MLSAKRLFDAVQSRGIEYFAGVPDSLLKDFCAYITDHAQDGQHVITANEGNAVALAMGHYLGSGQPALVYLQNSGIGNTVNPLLSLADAEVYGTPMLLVVGWRGAPEVPDEPQHVKQGRVMPQLLDAMELPWFQVGPETTDIDAVLDTAFATMVERSCPAVLLVKPETFEKYKLQKDIKTSFPMDREAAIRHLVDLLSPEDLVIATTGKASRELYEYRAARGDGHGRDFLTVGGMGHTASIAMGVAGAQPSRRVVCLDGDGSVIMHMGALAIIGQAKPKNFVHIVVNNGAHDSVGGQPTVGFDIDIAAIARASGYVQTTSVDTPAALTEAFGRLNGQDGPVLIEVRVNKGARADLGRPKTSPADNKRALMNTLQS